MKSSSERLKINSTRKNNMLKLLLPITFITSLFFFGCGNSDEKKNQEVMPAADTSKGVSAMKQDPFKKEQTALVYVSSCDGFSAVRNQNAATALIAN